MNTECWLFPYPLAAITIAGRSPEIKTMAVDSTLCSFNYPHSLIKSYAHWHLLMRPCQVTLGSLVLVCKEDATSYGKLSAEAIAEQRLIVAEIESILSGLFNYSKINYLMLMMVDPAVHFHVIPRYAKPVRFGGVDHNDNHWPKPPDLSSSISLTDEQHIKLQALLVETFSNHSLVNGSPSKKYRRLFTSGCFDIFHHGHLNILKRSKALCDHLIVGVSTDDLIIKSKGRPPIIPYEERVSIIQALDLVDEVIPQVDKNKQNIVDKYKVDAISVGDDWKGRYPPVTCEMEYFEYTPTVSSTILKEKLGLLNKQ